MTFPYYFKLPGPTIIVFGITAYFHVLIHNTKNKEPRYKINNR